MIIDCISDLHGHYPELEGGDLLIIAGDLTARDMKEDYAEFVKWCDHISFHYEKVIIVAGNHDNLVQKYGREILPTFCEYLCDSGTEFKYDHEIPHPASTRGCSIDALCYEQRKLKIWGSPWTTRFEGMNPACMAFTVDTEEELAEKWALIPDDTDILITHSPAHGMFDEVRKYDSQVREMIPENCGSTSLTTWMKNRWKCHESFKINIFGHIHECGGKTGMLNMIQFVNASHMNEHYQPVNKPIRIEL